MSAPYVDMIVIGLPRADTTDGLTPSLALQLTEAARRYVHADGAVLHAVEWTLATTFAEGQAWELPHDCEECRDGKRRALLTLGADPPTTVVAFGRLTCEPRS